MLEILQLKTLLLVAVAMALSLAHALEYPGKLRLTREHYLAMQPIYYPGFTIGGIAEPLGLIAMLTLLFLLPAASAGFWLSAAAFVALAAMHATYWLLTHPVNNFWLKDFELKGASAKFFAADPLRRSETPEEPDWTVLRDRWEHSHIIRAVLGLVSLTLFATSLVL